MDRRDFCRMTGVGAGFGLGALALQSFVPAGKAGDDAMAKNAKYADTRFNVKNFGAKGDGQTHDSAAIQKAIDEAGKVKGTVWFPAGIYLCHGLKVPANVALVADPVWYHRTTEDGAVLKLDDEDASCVLDITGAFGVHVHGLVLCGIRRSRSVNHGIYLNNPEDWSPKEDTVVFDDIKVVGFSGHGIFLKRVWLFIIRHCIFNANGGDGVRLIGWDGFVTDNQFSGNGGSGFLCEGVGATVMFTANRVEWNGGYGLYITEGDDWNVTGNAFDRNWGAGLCIENASAIAVTGNTFRRCGNDSSRLPEGENSCQVRLIGVKGLAMTGNSFIAGQDDGGVGKFSPKLGFIIKNLAYSTISNNALWNGYLEKMMIDEGGHTELIMKDNPGCPKTGF